MPDVFTIPHPTRPVKDANRQNRPESQVSAQTVRRTTMAHTTVPTVTPTSRAALRRVEAGNMALCTLCDEQVKFAAKVNRMQVIANVYMDGRWDRVEHFHDVCYEAAGEPYGEPSAAIAKVRRQSA
jgi:hypothetical protein